MNIVDYLIEYNKNPNNKELCKQVPCDEVLYKVIVCELLTWMKLQQKRLLWIENGRKSMLKPLCLNMSYPWCQALTELIETDELFKESFQISDNELDFKDDVSEEFRLYAFRKSYDEYNPPMIIG